MAYEDSINVTIEKNPDGTYKIEEFGVHYGSASFGTVIAWFVDRLLDTKTDGKG